MLWSPNCFCPTYVMPFKNRSQLFAACGYVKLMDNYIPWMSFQTLFKRYAYFLFYIQGGYKLSPQCFAWMTNLLKGLANGRVILALEVTLFLHMTQYHKFLSFLTRYVQLCTGIWHYLPISKHLALISKDKSLAFDNIPSVPGHSRLRTSTHRGKQTTAYLLTHKL